MQELCPGGSVLADISLQVLLECSRPRLLRSSRHTFNTSLLHVDHLSNPQCLSRNTSCDANSPNAPQPSSLSLRPPGFVSTLWNAFQPFVAPLAIVVVFVATLPLVCHPIQYLYICRRLYSCDALPSPSFSLSFSLVTIVLTSTPLLQLRAVAPLVLLHLVQFPSTPSPRCTPAVQALHCGVMMGSHAPVIRVIPPLVDVTPSHRIRSCAPRAVEKLSREFGSRCSRPRSAGLCLVLTAHFTLLSLT